MISNVLAKRSSTGLVLEELNIFDSFWVSKRLVKTLEDVVRQVNWDGNYQIPARSVPGDSGDDWSGDGGEGLGNESDEPTTVEARSLSRGVKPGGTRESRATGCVFS